MITQYGFRHPWPWPGIKPQPGEPPPNYIPALEPSPHPWAPVVHSLISALSLRDVAAGLPPGAAKKSLEESINGAVTRFLDDCGTPWPGWRGPWPPPGPWDILEIISELSLVANSFQAGNLRTEVLNVAGAAYIKAQAAAGQLAGR